MQYFDKNGNEIKGGMTIRMEDGNLELVYETDDGYGNPDLGINATNEAFMERHPDWDREFYSLSMFNMKGVEICPMGIAQEEETNEISGNDPSAFEMSMQYGYAWNADKTAFETDEEAAAVVRQIFQWKLAGVSYFDMCQRLDASGVPIPEVYKHGIGQRNGGHQTKGVWNTSTIQGILRNRAYIGEKILRKTETAIYKGVKRRRTSADEQIVTEDAHPAIISKEDFETVQQMISGKSGHRAERMKASEGVRAGFVDLFRGILVCGDCGSRIYYKRQTVDCKNPYYSGRYECSKRVRRLPGGCPKKLIRQEDLEERVLNAIRDQLQVALDYEKLLKLLRGSAGELGVREKHNAAISSIKIRLNALTKKRTGLYEDYDAGILDAEEYAFAKQAFEEQYEKLNRLLDEAVQRKNRFVESISPDNKWLTMMRGASGLTKLTQDLVDAMIEKVTLYEGGRIEVKLRYHDVFEEMCEGVRLMEQEAKAYA